MSTPTRGRITLRTAGASDAKKLYALIQANLAEGHLVGVVAGFSESGEVCHFESPAPGPEARRVRRTHDLNSTRNARTAQVLFDGCKPYASAAVLLRSNV